MTYLCQVCCGCLTVTLYFFCVLMMWMFWWCGCFDDVDVIDHSVSRSRKLVCPFCIISGLLFSLIRLLSVLSRNAIPVIGSYCTLCRTVLYVWRWCDSTVILLHHLFSVKRVDTTWTQDSMSPLNKEELFRPPGRRYHAYLVSVGSPIMDEISC